MEKIEVNNKKWGGDLFSWQMFNGKFEDEIYITRDSLDNIELLTRKQALTKFDLPPYFPPYGTESLRNLCEKANLIEISRYNEFSKSILCELNGEKS